MKRNIFLFSSLMLLSGVCFAQSKEEPSLFPELDFGVIQVEAESDDIGGTEAENLLNEQAEIQEETEPEVQQNEEEIIQEEETVLVQEEVPESQPETEQEMTTEEEEESEEDKDRLIYVALNDIKNYPSPIKTVSYCSGYFILFNDTKRTVQEISGTLGIGDQQEEFKFENIQPDGKVRSSVQIVGEACDFILQIPDIQIDVCKVERMSDKKCREKILFVPINSSR
ncbi:MAG: hypothetical protein E7021_02350 [Alphaproteobacteria bacterium]|nr:hypothetical protein [Alphaproteobacteria bacterium]